MKRNRQAKIVATLGPSSDDETTIKALFEAGADVFRLNFSHGTHDQHAARVARIRSVEKQVGRPIAILQDLQGPKLRIGTFANGPIELKSGDRFRLDLDPQGGSQERVQMPHPEIFEALVPGTALLINDGKIRLTVESCGHDYAETIVVNGGRLSDRKGVNVPSVLLPISAMTDKDHADLKVGLQLGVDWVALSFVQRPEDIQEIRGIVQGRAGVLAKIEKPAAVEALAAIIDECDAIMVARGDLGVEMPAERVPRIQKHIVRACRKAGKPVIVATQMLESMIEAPVPTRAEASDVATAIYDGADAVMLSAESASGQFPREAVAMMDCILSEVESDPHYRQGIDASQESGGSSLADVVCHSLRVTAQQLPISGIVTYTRSGATSLKAARERPTSRILSITPDIHTARRLALAWGVHSVGASIELTEVPEIVANACSVARQEGFAKPGELVAVAAGTPFGTIGSTNFLHIAKA